SARARAFGSTRAGRLADTGGAYDYIERSASCTRSKVERVPQSLQRCLVKCLAERRMRMNRSGDILQHRALLEGVRELARELGNVIADRVNGNQPVITLARDDANKAA